MRVALYGSSLFIEGLEESLKGVPGVEVLRLRAEANDLLRQTRRVRPDSLVVEAGALSDQVSLGLLKELPGLLLVALDRETSDLLVLSGREARAVTTTDLVRVIEARRDSTPRLPLWQAHLGRLSQVISRWVGGLRARPTDRFIQEGERKMKNLTKRNKILLGIAGLVIVVVVAGLVLLGPSGAGLFGASNLTITPSVPYPWTMGEIHRLESSTIWDCNFETDDTNVVKLIDPDEFVKSVQVLAYHHGTAVVKAHCGWFHALTATTTVTVVE